MSLTDFLFVIVSISLLLYNPQNEMYQKLKRNVHFLSGG